jgi:hypothetical protein
MFFARNYLAGSTKPPEIMEQYRLEEVGILACIVRRRLLEL